MTARAKARRGYLDEDPSLVATLAARSGDPLQPQALLLTILGDYMFARPEPVWSGGLVHALEIFGFTPASARLALSRFSRKGHLERTKRGRITHYALSTTGVRLLAEGQRRIFSFGEQEWDGTWTIVSYSIPEERRAVRDRLRSGLAFLGFASVHDGTWFSPSNRASAVGDLLDEFEIGKFAYIFVGSPAPRHDVSDLVERGWDLDMLGRRYAWFVGEFERYATRSVQRRMSPEAAFVTRTWVMHVFRRFPFLDPELPEAIVGAQWQRARAIELFHAVWDGLAAPAEQHFETLVSEPPVS